MFEYTRHILRQRHAAAALGGTVWRQLWSRNGRANGHGAAIVAPAFPGPELTARVAPPAPALLRDYLLHVGGDPAAYRGAVPPHLFLQWSLPLAARTLRDLPYPLLRILNAGCRLSVQAPLPADEPLALRAQLVSADDDGRRAVLHQRIVTGTDATPDALIADLYTVVPSDRSPLPSESPLPTRSGEGQGEGQGNEHLRRSGSNSPPPSPQPSPDRVGRGGPDRIPESARLLARWSLPRNAGLAFAALTGDFNPIHWAPPYARAFGHAGPILHGFGTLARAWEALVRARFAGAAGRLRALDVRFLRPLVLPARVGLYVTGSRLYVGGTPGARAVLAGSFEENDTEAAA